MGVPNVGSASGSPSSYTPDNNTDFVQPGESTLSDVASRLGIDPASLRKANPQIQDPSNLNPGQEVNLPAEAPPIPLRDPAANSTPAQNPASTSTLPKAPVGDPIAASAMKANLSVPVHSVGKPEDYVTLNPIHPGDTNRTDMKVITEDHSVGDVHSETYRPETNEVHDSAGLANRLSELNGGRPLTPFEKNLAAGWGKEDPSTVMVPVAKIGSSQVEAYALTRGGSGDRVTTYYDRQGTVLGEKHDEAGLVNEGLGPIDYVMGGLAMKGIVGGLFRAGRAMLAGEGAAAAAGEGELGASALGKRPLPEGSGTSIYMKNPKGGIATGEATEASATSSPKTTTAPKAPATEEFTKDDLNAIKSYEEAGMSHEDAVDVIRRRGHESVEVVPTGPNGGGTTRLPPWKTPGPGNKRP